MDKKSISEAQFSAITLRLTPKALDWLNGITCGVPHLTIYKDLLYGMTVSPSAIKKRGQDVPLKPLEVEASANSFSERWNMSRKVMTRLFKEMGELGLIIVDSNKLRSVLTMCAVVDCTPGKPSSSNPPTDENQAEQQNVAQPTSHGGDDEATPSVSTEANCADGTAAPKVTADPSSQTSVPPEGKASDTYYKPDGQQLHHDDPTLFDDMKE